MKKITKMTSISLWAKHLINYGAYSQCSVFSVQSNRTIQRWTNDMAIFEIKKENKAKWKRPAIHSFTENNEIQWKWLWCGLWTEEVMFFFCLKKKIVFILIRTPYTIQSSFDTIRHSLSLAINKMDDFSRVFIKIQCLMRTYCIGCDYHIQIHIRRRNDNKSK